MTIGQVFQTRGFDFRLERIEGNRAIVRGLQSGKRATVPIEQLDRYLIDGSENDVMWDEVRSEHQSQLLPSDNKFHRGNGSDGRHYWLTPPELYAELDAEFHFDFDPCPYPLPEGFDGLTCEWGRSNYVNPPFGSIIHQGKKKGPTAWVRKAIEECSKGKRVVLVYPVDKWVLMLLSAIGTEVRNLGDVRWLSIEDGRPGLGTGRHIAAFILEPGQVKPQRIYAGEPTLFDR